ncbi:hypothetical protein Patl1_18863 [Pistacia atlantica]|uniref:Uncharacterized protein n=1 Tax=Pistacia atlantica TaxID=434234 RepID=A0ACC1C076_9ROSI|nr:hypothetical protein Patl1_18863 [Pistacia atlantica]
MMASMLEKSEGWSLIKFVSILDELEHGDIRKDFEKSRNTMRVMPGKLKDLIENINQSSDNEQIRCVISDVNAQWGLKVAQKMGIPSNAIHDGLISISEENLPWKANEFPWSFRGHEEVLMCMAPDLCLCGVKLSYVWSEAIRRKKGA